ncbi:MAG: MFS transporter, partial [Pseudomonadota bacterium]|nr:MFS transporter [Pseudomonadota bacterium]
MSMAQGVSMTVMNVNIINTGLAGAILAPELWMATLPLSLQFVAVMLATLPASLLMARFGRRLVFLCGVAISITATMIQALAIITGQFGMFVMGSVLLGVAHGVAQFYRYAAADGLPDQEKPKAVSFVLLGGLAAAVIGPEIAHRFVDVVEGARYAGAFIGAGVLHLLGFVILAGMDSPKLPQSAHAGRDMSVFFALPGFRLGLVAAALGYAVMSFLMTATPLQIVNVSQLGVAENARVIQWHVIAMFAPSFFTGHLIARFGIRQVMMAGLVMYGLCIFMALSGTAFWDYFAALLLLGLGWNFLYVSGSALIARLAEPEERG